jgi:hypothetical protein
MRKAKMLPQLDTCILEFFYGLGQQNILNKTTWASVDWCVVGGHE